MKFVNYCPCCGSKALTEERKYQYNNPHISLEADYEKLLDNITLERLNIMFECICPESDSIEVAIMHCKNCAFYFTNPRMTYENIKAKYAAIEKYAFSKKRYEKYPASRLDVRARRISELLISNGFQPYDRTESILDVGGAWGYNLLPFKGKAQLFVVDLEQWNMKSDPEIKWLCREITDLSIDHKFECILYLHTLEHEIDPPGMIRQLASRLKPDGRLYIEVPLGIFREIDHLSEPITHINFFGERSLYELLHRCGLDVIHLSTRYQWVMTGAQWCVNIIAINSKTKTKKKPKPLPEWFQRANPYYYLVAGLNKIL